MMIREDGIVMVAVLWICAIIMWLSLQIGAETRMLGEEQMHILRKSQALHLAIGGCYEALGRMGLPLGTGLEKTTDENWQPDGEPHIVNYETGQAIVIIESENKKVNVNLTQHDQLKTVLEQAGQDPDSAARLADVIGDFIDGDDTPRLNGAEQDHYKGLGSNQGPFNGPLTSLDQLLLVPGMTQQLFYGYGQTPDSSQEDPDSAPQDPAIPGRHSLFRMLTIYGNNVTPQDDLPSETLYRPKLFRSRDILDRLGEAIITWESGGIYRILSCGRSSSGAPPVVMWLTFRYAPESDIGYEVLYRKLL